MELKKIIDALRDYYEESIFVTDGDGNIVFANKLAAQRLGTTIDQLEGRNVRDLMADGLYENSTVLEAIRTKQTVVGSLGGNRDMVTYSNSVPIFDTDGNVEMVVTNNMSLKRNLEWEQIISRDREENARLRRLR